MSVRPLFLSTQVTASSRAVLVPHHPWAPRSEKQM